MTWNAMLVQDGTEFLTPMRHHLMEEIKQGNHQVNVEECLHWCVCEFLLTLYLFPMEGHHRPTTIGDVSQRALRRWPEARSTFHTVFRGPATTWDDDTLVVQILGRDLYIYYFKDIQR